MFIVYPIILAIIISFFLKRSEESSPKLKFKFSPLVIIALIIQIIIFNTWWVQHMDQAFTPGIYGISLVLIYIFILFNHKFKGLKTIAFGVAANGIAIFSNGGLMPTTPQALMAINPEYYSKITSQGAYFNSRLVNETTNFSFLCDIFHTPTWLPLANVFSVGDVLIAVGAFILILTYMTIPLARHK